MQDTFADLREYALAEAKRQGCDGADVLTYESSSLSLSVLNSKLEDSERAESTGVGLRVFKGTRAAYAAGADVSAAGIKLLLDHLVEAANHVPADPHTRLATPHETAKTIPDLALHDPQGEPAFETMRALAVEAEATGLAHNGISKSDGASAGFSITSIGLSTSNGFNGAYTKTDTGLSLGLIGGQGDGMERDGASTAAVLFNALETPKAIGTRAALRTLAKLNPRQAKTGQFPVVFDKRISASMLRHLIAALNGPRLAKRTSFLNDALGTQVLAKAIHVLEDPLKPYGLRSRPFDGEGLNVYAKPVVQNGVVETLFLDLRSADRLGMKPTGHASRGLSSPPAPSTSNIWLAAGSISFDDLIKPIQQGFLVTELLGSQISLSTGDYSRGAAGFWIENGVVAYPVSEATIAGNLKDMFLHMQPASDLEFKHGVDAPSLRVDGMTIAAQT